MEEFSDVWFKQRAVIEFLTAEKVPPIEIVHAGDKFVNMFFIEVMLFFLFDLFDHLNFLVCMFMCIFMFFYVHLY